MPYLSPIRRKKAAKTPDAVLVFSDGREICQNNAAGEREYKRRLHLMISRQLNRCQICHKFSNYLQFDHQDGRGMNGSHRSDKIWTEDGQPYNAALCPSCNLEKASKRYEYVDGIYGPVQSS